ncbi:MAG: translation initiation factor IF-2 [Bacteroidetes bacterium]|nr:translation initiation factor IF-2 [Bacteroidota bacterium]MBS1628851.1 translation initiation factor IF-2 [Bacteroidota bacterium]
MSTVATKTPRLLAAAKEFNIGKGTLLEYLSGKGFEVVDSAATKLSEEMYDALEREFAPDRTAKRKSEAIALPKTETKKEPAPAKAKITTPEVEPAAPEVLAPIEESVITVEIPQPEPEPVVEAPAIEEPVPTEPEVVVELVPEPVELPKEPEQPETIAPTDEPGHIETIRTKLEGPKIQGKIDLEKISKSPKKATKKAAKAPAESETPVKKTAAKKKTEPATPKQAPKAPEAIVPAAKTTKPVAVPAAPVVTPEETKPEHIEVKAPQLAGPKIIGRIQLPVEDKSSAGQKRDRKRIPIQKREGVRPQTGAGGRSSSVTIGANPNNRNGRGGGGNTNNTGNRRNTTSDKPQEVDSKEIQKKIQETQARLAGGGRNSKGSKGKYRRDKRELMAEKRAAAESGENNIIQVTEFISVSDLANLMDVSFADVISKCMSLGIMVSINQRLDAEVIELVASEFGYEVQFINLEQGTEGEEEETVDAEENLLPRAPIVTIMGHVDHGKTSLLDYIRRANVVAGEAGGITQHIGAYQVSLENDKRITFLDTPGHEAFTAMRARGAKAADVAVIVIAADDAIMPQTREAISHAQAAQLPMIFALNKIDKDGANPEKIREQLAGMNILVEEWGGKYQSQEISAKKGLNVDALLEKILLEAELLDLKANPNREASGSVIEASLDKGRGYVATILVQNGTLSQGDMVVSGQYYGRVKAMLNERGQRVQTAGPSSAVQVLGLNGAPQAGEKFKMYESENDAKEVANRRAQILREQGIRARKHLTLDEIGRRLALGNFKELPVIIKGDVDGSVEALSDSLQKLSTEEVAVNVVMKGVGAITESDVNLATASDAIIIGFQVRPTSQASRLAEQENIEIRSYSIIYDAINEIKSAMEGLLEPTVEKKIVANVEVREVYKITGVGTVAGCYVLDGKITRNTKVNLLRDSIVIYTGELASLKRFKDDVKEVAQGYECGMSIKNYNDIRIGDIIEGFDEVEVKRTL